MEIRTLEWDSAFFGLRIGRADIQTSDDAKELATQYEKLKSQYKLIYVFCMDGLTFDVKGAELVDEKILYSKSCENKVESKDVMLYLQPKPSASLYKLTLVSGGYSRFRLDERFPKGSYRRLYEKWIENACPQQGTNKQILILPDTNDIVRGMITINHEGELGHIGLVAVDPDCQHQGIGGKIIPGWPSFAFHATGGEDNHTSP